MSEPTGKGIRENTPLSAFLKVIFGLEILKSRGIPLHLGVMPDSLIDLDGSDYAELCAKRGAIFALERLDPSEIPTELFAMLGSLIVRNDPAKEGDVQRKKFTFNDPYYEEGVRKHRLASGLSERERRPGGHATLAAMALQMLHRKECALFDLTYVVKTGWVGHTYLKEFLVRRMKERDGFPVAPSFILSNGQDRLSLIQNVYEGEGKEDRHVKAVYRFVDSIDEKRQFTWDELDTHPPQTRLRIPDCRLRISR
jgi:hypothetical protein